MAQKDYHLVGKQQVQMWRVSVPSEWGDEDVGNKEEEFHLEAASFAPPAAAMRGPLDFALQNNAETKSKKEKKKKKKKKRSIEELQEDETSAHAKQAENTTKRKHDTKIDSEKLRITATEPPVSNSNALMKKQKKSKQAPKEPSVNASATANPLQGNDKGKSKSPKLTPLQEKLKKKLDVRICFFPLIASLSNNPMF